MNEVLNQVSDLIKNFPPCKERLPGLSWVGGLGSDGLIYSYAFYRGFRVNQILEAVEKSEGDLAKAAKELNGDEVDETGLISPKEIRKITEFAKNNRIQNVREP